jgi:glycerol uptake facilitator protein
VSVTVATAIAPSGLPTGLLNPVFAINNMILNAKDSAIGLPVAAGFIAILFQFLGAGMGQILVILVFKKHYDATEDSSAILGTFATGPAIRSLK